MILFEKKKNRQTLQRQMTGSEKNLKEKKKKILSSKNAKTTQRENHHFKGITHTTLFIITIIISTHNKNETDFREKEEKSRRRSIRSRIQRRVEK